MDLLVRMADIKKILLARMEVPMNKMHTKVLGIVSFLFLLGSSAVVALPNEAVVALTSARVQKEIKAVSFEKNQVWILDRKAVELQKKSVKAYFAKNKTHRMMVQAGTIAAIAAIGGYAFYRLVYLPHAEELVAQEAAKQARLQPELAVSKETIVKLESKVNYLVQKVGQVGEDVVRAGNLKPVEPIVPAVVPPLTGLAWYRNAALSGIKETGNAAFGVLKFCGTIMLQAGPPMILSGFVLREIPTVADVWGRFVTTPVEKICHPSDSTWFINNQVNYKDLFKHLQERVEGLPLVFDETERAYLVSQITTDLNIFSHQLARVVAFLEIQSETVLKTNKICGKHLTEKSAYIFTLIQTFDKKMADLLSKKEKHSEIPTAVATFKRKLKDEFSSFDLYERAAFHDIVPFE